MKTKRIISLLASLAIIVTAVTGAMSVSAVEANGKIGDNLTWTLDANGRLTISGEGAMASPEVTDISQENGFDTTGIGILKESLKTQLKEYSDIYTYKEHMEEIKEVVIGEGVTSIGFAAFYKMPNLESVTLPSTISEFKGIGYSTQINAVDSHGHGPIHAYASLAFAECTKLKKLTLTEGMTAIGSIAFYGCTALESVRIPSTIKYEKQPEGVNDLESNYGWGPYSFVGCTLLKDIILSEGLTVIGGCAFEDTAVESVVIPSTIENWDVADTNVTVVPPGSVADGLESISDIYSSAFANCKNLSSVIFTDGIKTIGKVPFWGCTSLKKVAIPKSITNMYKSFEYCPGLQEAYIEDGAQISSYNSGNNSYFDYSFDYCVKLKKLEIPSGVEVDHHNAQWCTGCSSLTDLYIHGKDYGYFPVGNNTSKVHCYSGTKTLDSLLVGGVPSVRIVDIEEEIENAQAELNKAVTEAEKYSEEDYTAESYGVLKALLEKAGKYGEDPSVMSMEDTSEGIYAAIDGLVDKSNEPSSSDPSSSDPSDSSNPTGSDQSQPSNSGSSQPTSAQPVTNAPTTATPKPTTPPTVTTTVAKPEKVKNVKVIAKKKKLNVSWKKVSGATGYEIQYATNNKFTKGKKTVTVKKNKVTLKKLKSKKKYFVKVRAYKLANGNKYFGKWSKVVKKKTK